jgi:hypothetical protein
MPVLRGRPYPSITVIPQITLILSTILAKPVLESNSLLS